MPIMPNFITPMTTKWLLHNSPTSLAGGIPFFESMVFDRWGHLDESIRWPSVAIRRSQAAPSHRRGRHPKGHR